jgi:hypothetical protein
MGIVNKGVHGKQNGANIDNVGRLQMWSNQKMKFATFIHDENVKCFHMVIQGTHKLVVMGYTNFKDHVLIKR